MGSVQREEVDSVVFFYSTENLNYLCRKIAFQYNLAADLLTKDERVGDKVRFYAYDAYKHGFPGGIPKRSGPPQDLDGSKVGTPEQSKSGLPNILLFPSGKKHAYSEFHGRPFTDEIIDFVLENAENGVAKK